MSDAAEALRRRSIEVLPALVFLAAAVAAWEVTVRVLNVAPYLVPAPSRVWAAFLETRDVLPAHLRTTLAEALLGLIAACMAGVTVAAVL
ncbi:MAG: ABC transporter permease, partial [Dehalococcoidia bacterium]|nr:ABC transporter permease [Dehalococcoidia bacterium]